MCFEGVEMDGRDGGLEYTRERVRERERDEVWRVVELSVEISV